MSTTAIEYLIDAFKQTENDIFGKELILKTLEQARIIESHQRKMDYIKGHEDRDNKVFNTSQFEINK